MAKTVVDYETRADLCEKSIEVEGKGTGYFKGARNDFATLRLWPSGESLGEWPWASVVWFHEQGQVRACYL